MSQHHMPHPRIHQAQILAIPLFAEKVHSAMAETVWPISAGFHVRVAVTREMANG